MTKVFDRHGTEILKGDVLASSIGGLPKHQLPNRVENPLCYVGIEPELTVMARADGTPVYRYKGGEDIRIGDKYANADGEPFEVKKGFLNGAASAWATCTLIRRANPEASIERELLARQAQPEPFCPRGKHVIDRRSECCVYCGVTSQTIEDVEQPKTIADARRSPKHQYTNDLEMGLIKCPACGCHNRVGTVHRCDSPCPDCGSPMGSYSEHSCAKNNPGIAIDRFADWLSQPTLSDRFAEFKSEVLRCLRENGAERARVSFDVTDGEPWALLGFGDFEDQTVIYGEDIIDSVDLIVDSWIRALGRKAIAGR